MGDKLNHERLDYLASYNLSHEESTMNTMHRFTLSLMFVNLLLFNPASAKDDQIQHSAKTSSLNEYQLCTRKLQGDIFMRTELFFGLSRPNNSEVTEEEFQHFIDTKVTPRFPDGLTLINAKGQFKDSTGTIIQEDSKLLILLYPFNKASNQAVEQIRTDYKNEFQQQSVLRVDEQSCVSF
jgi:Protein of unknown function (DUF3574)